jgi:hypothetical protein
MKRVIGLVGLLLLAGCVGNGVQFGGIEKPAPSPSATIPCNQAGLVVAKKAQIVIPGDVVAFMSMNQNNFSSTVMLGYDVDREGVPVNVHFTGPPQVLEHATRQKLVRAVADAIEEARFSWPAVASYATGCSYTYQIGSTHIG